MFNHVAVAGAFDHLHLGHKKLLETAQQSGRQVLVGLCQEQMLIHKSYQLLIENYSVRQKNVSQFLSSKPSEIFPLKDIYGPAAETDDLDAIVCTTQTKPNVDKINQLRQLNTLKPLTHIVVDLVPSSDRQILSSTRIRGGEVNRDGFAYQQLFLEHRKLILPDYHRHYLQKPFSKLITANQIKPIIKRQPPFLTVAVGDITALTFIKQQLPLDLAVIDAKTRRQPYLAAKKLLTISRYASNPTATITLDLVNQLQLCLKKTNQCLMVNGEEDLAVLPLILLSPLKTAIFYGQPYQGLVYIRVTEKSKQKALNLLRKFI